MLENSKDLLNLVIAFCILWLTIFICWMIYYVALIFKRIHEVMEKVTNALEAVTEFFTKAKDRLEKATSSLTILLELGKKIYDSIAEKKTKSAKAKKDKAETAG